MKPDSCQIIIRKATPDDLSAIYNLVIELAIYEKEPDAVTTTLDDYHHAFNSDLIKPLVAESNGEILGMTISYLTFSTWRGRMLYLEDFVISEKHRRKGIGDLLFDAVIQQAHDLDCRMVKWQVLDWNTPAVNFYRKKKATIEKEWWNGKIIFS